MSGTTLSNQYNNAAAPQQAAPSASAQNSNATTSPEKSNEDGEEKPKRTQTCFRCRQSKVKCVFEQGAPTCRRCQRLGVSCELQGKREPLSWQMRVQHQLAALEGSLQSFLEKQMIEPSNGNHRLNLPRSRESMTPIVATQRGAMGAMGAMGADAEAARKRRRTTIGTPSDQNATGMTYATEESPVYAENNNSASASSYPSTSQFSPRDGGLIGMVTGSRYSNSPRPKGLMVDSSSSALMSAVPDDHGLSAQDDHAVPTESGRNAFAPQDTHDLASRPLSAIQKLRMSVLDRKKELSHSHERIFPNLYRMATADVGSKDPRPNVIKQDLVSPTDAVTLFRFFAEYLDQYSFGFPTYRPDAIMSPMILTSVVCVASLHHAQLNRLHWRVKADLMARLQTDDPSFPASDVYETLFSSSAHRSSQLQSNLHFENELDPELGIGVEEIVGASLFASWFGGRRAWMASRLARWWSAKFLRQQQHPAMMTMGEIMSILPPPRDLGKQELLCVWLSAYITEIHQACMEGTPSIAGLNSPHAVCDSLQYSKGLSQRTTLRDRVLIMHSKIAWILSKAYHTAGGGAMEWGKGEKAANSKESPSRSCQSCRDGSTNETANTATMGANDAESCLQAVLDAFEELDGCQEEMAGRLDADAIDEAETMLYLDLFLAKVLIASIGCDFLDSTLWDGSLGQVGGMTRGKDKNSAESDLQSLRSRALRESLMRGVDGALRSLELICLPNMGAASRSEVSLNVLVLPLWFHWALTRSVLFLMNVLAEYPERLLPRDRTRSVELINMFLDLYSKHIGHANMVLSHANSRNLPVESTTNYGACSWSPSDELAARGDHPRSSTNSTAADPVTQTSWQPPTRTSETIQHPATPLLDTLSQCQMWARHGGVM